MYKKYLVMRVQIAHVVANVTCFLSYTFYQDPWLLFRRPPPLRTAGQTAPGGGNTFRNGLGEREKICRKARRGRRGSLK